MINGRLSIDVSHIIDGYFIAKNLKPDNKRCKLRVAANNRTIFYNLNGEEIFPLQFGNGQYTIELYRNTSASRYAVVGKLRINVKLKSNTAPYLHPNQYVNYSADSPCAVKAAELCANCTSPADKVMQINNYVKKNISYNYVKALTVGSGVLPDIDGCFAKRMGICQDIAALMVAMLRTQGVPASLVIGNADTKYHAWVRVYIGDTVMTYDPTAAIQHKNVKTYITERWY